jgi:hypothetical protein
MPAFPPNSVWEKRETHSYTMCTIHRQTMDNFRTVLMSSSTKLVDNNYYIFRASSKKAMLSSSKVAHASTNNVEKMQNYGYPRYVALSSMIELFNGKLDQKDVIQ